ncbi:50S ribosomal protein L20 [Candidatus Dependentiae bacterium]|nr:50S ribosomal protein L20 [Candidatus Dependentiae bacterium]
MSRVKRGVVTHRRHKRLFKMTKGYWGQRSNIFRRATETLLRAMAFAFKGRKMRKRDFRSMFITRVNAASRQHGLSYSVFIHKLNTAKVALNRKMLSQLAIYDPKAFEAVIAKVK